MKRIKTVVISIIVITIFATCGRWLYEAMTHNTATKPDSPSHPSQYISNATFYDFDSKGELKSVLKTPSLVHFKDKNTSFLTAPELSSYTSKHVPWHITAEHGMTQEGTAVIYLWGKVRMTQLSVNQQPETTILTEQVTYHQQTEELETDRNVTIIRPGVRLTANGMTANLKKGIIKTQNHSRGRYDPVKAR